MQMTVSNSKEKTDSPQHDLPKTSARDTPNQPLIRIKKRGNSVMIFFSIFEKLMNIMMLVSYS